MNEGRDFHYSWTEKVPVLDIMVSSLSTTFSLHLERDKKEQLVGWALVRLFLTTPPSAFTLKTRSVHTINQRDDIRCD